MSFAVFEVEVLQVGAAVGDSQGMSLSRVLHIKESFVPTPGFGAVEGLVGDKFSAQPLLEEGQEPTNLLLPDSRGVEQHGMSQLRGNFCLEEPQRGEQP